MREGQGQRRPLGQPWNYQGCHCHPKVTNGTRLGTSGASGRGEGAPRTRPQRAHTAPRPLHACWTVLPSASRHRARAAPTFPPTGPARHETRLQENKETQPHGPGWGSRPPRLLEPDRSPAHGCGRWVPGGPRPHPPVVVGGSQATSVEKLRQDCPNRDAGQLRCPALSGKRLPASTLRNF